MQFEDYNDFIQDVGKAGYVSVIVGGRGSGKTALGYKIIEDVNKMFAKPVYILGLPEDAHKLVPKEYNLVDNIVDIPNNSAVLVDESALQFSSKEWHTQGNIELARLIEIARHKKLSMVFITLNTASVDKNVLRFIDAMLFKQLSLLQKRLERTELKDVFKEVMDTFGSLGPDKDPKAYTYVISNRISGGMMKTELPSFWSEDLSECYKFYDIRSVDKNDDKLETFVLDGGPTNKGEWACEDCPYWKEDDDEEDGFCSLGYFDAPRKHCDVKPDIKGEAKPKRFNRFNRKHWQRNPPEKMLDKNDEIVHEIKTDCEAILQAASVSPDDFKIENLYTHYSDKNLNAIMIYSGKMTEAEAFSLFNLENKIEINQKYISVLPMRPNPPVEITEPGPAPVVSTAKTMAEPKEPLLPSKPLEPEEPREPKDPTPPAKEVKHPWQMKRQEWQDAGQPMDGLEKYLNQTGVIQNPWPASEPEELKAVHDYMILYGKDALRMSLDGELEPKEFESKDPAYDNYTFKVKSSMKDQADFRPDLREMILVYRKKGYREQDILRNVVKAMKEAGYDFETIWPDEVKKEVW